MNTKTIVVVIRVLLTLVLIVYSSFETGIVTGMCLFLIFLFIEVQNKTNEGIIKTLQSIAPNDKVE